jgi:hypothetical protein
MSMQATYSPDDNKLRLYPTSKLGTELYQRVKAAGFKWAPHQKLFVAPAWTPAREDLLIELCGEIEDEDTSLTDRAEERADRCEEYSAARLAESKAYAKSAWDRAYAMNGQPILIGHHSEKRHRREIERMDNESRKANVLWKRSEYWTERAQGAIHHAKYKERPDVRARRIKGLEADERKHEKEKKHAETRKKLWEACQTQEHALALANVDTGWTEITCADGQKRSVWSALENGHADLDTVRPVIVRGCDNGIAWHDRWLEHTRNRLAYERAMYAEGPAIAADRTKPEKGGAVRCWVSMGRWTEVAKVNKVSVSVWDNFGNGGKDFLRTVPFDELSAVMSKAEWEAMKAGAKPAEPKPAEPAPVPCSNGSSAADFEPSDADPGL